MEVSTDPDIILTLKYNRLSQKAYDAVPPISRARETLYFYGPQRQEEAKADIEEFRVSDLHKMGQATLEEVNAARERSLEARIAELDAEFDAGEAAAETP